MKEYNNLWLLKIALEVIFFENIKIIILENKTKIIINYYKSLIMTSLR